MLSRAWGTESKLELSTLCNVRFRVLGSGFRVDMFCHGQGSPKSPEGKSQHLPNRSVFFSKKGGPWVPLGTPKRLLCGPRPKWSSLFKSYVPALIDWKIAVYGLLATTCRTDSRLHRQHASQQRFAQNPKVSRSSSLTRTQELSRIIVLICLHPSPLKAWKPQTLSQPKPRWAS